MNAKSVACFLIITFGVTWAVHAQDSNGPSDVKTFRLKGEYGTLIYDGVVERVDAGTNYEFTVKELRLKFYAQGAVNRTNEIALKNIVFVATLKPPKDGPWTVIFQKSKSLKLVLNSTSPTGTIASIKFIVPKAVLQKADSAGLSVNNGRLMWPMSQDLR